MHGLTVFLCAAAPGAKLENSSASSFRPPNRALYPQGQFVYERNCVPCHGKYGEGDGELVKGWDVLPRNFRLASFKYRSTPYGKLPTDTDLQRTIRMGVSGTAMPVFAQLTDKDVKAVIEYIKFFSPAWREPDNFAPPVGIPKPPGWFQSTSDRAKAANAGKTLFLKTCAICHGEHADGNGPSAAALLDDAGKPIRPADLRRPLRSGATAEDAWRTIATGISGTPMVGFHGALTPDEIWQLVALIQSVRTPLR